MAEGFLYKPLLQDEDKKHSRGKAKAQAGRPVKSESRVTRTKSNALVDTTFPSEMRNHQNDSTCLVRI